MPHIIRTPIQKRFSDIDSFHHVNNVAQQMYFDVGKSDFFDRVLGREVLFAPTRIITAATETSYLAQIQLGDAIEVTTEVERIGNKSLTLLQRIIADDGSVRSESRSVMVAFDFDAQQSIPIPDHWRKALETERHAARSAPAEGEGDIPAVGLPLKRAERPAREEGRSPERKGRKA